MGVGVLVHSSNLDILFPVILKLVTVCLEECVDTRVAMYGILLLCLKPPALTMFKQTENELDLSNVVM